MSLNSWKIWSALAATGVGVAVNLATDWKYNVAAWAALPFVTVLATWLGAKADQDGNHKERHLREGRKPLVLRWEERHGDIRRTVSTTSEKVATEFLRRVPPLD